MKFLSAARLLAATAIFMLTIVFFSCQKENRSNDPGTDSVQEDEASAYSDESVRADASFDDLDEIGQVAAEEDDYAATEGDNGRYFPGWHALRAIIGNCATVTVSPVDGTFPKTITIDFGDSCVGADLKVRSGKILIHITAPRRKAGSVVTIALANYSLNRLKLEGTKVITNTSTGGTLQYTVQVVGGKVTFANGHGYTFQSLKQKKQIAGKETALIIDNVFEITGYADIVFTTGASVHVETIDPLIKKVICPWRSDGTLKVTVNDRFNFKLDYGFPSNGNCDNKALLSWNNKQRVVLLP
jgi:hypothetical protein